MDSDELRRACAQAELVQLEDGRWALSEVDEETGERTGTFSWAWYEDDPALPSYIASRLVEKVRERDKEWGMQHALAHQLTDNTGDCEYHCMATDEQRIRACMEVLK